MNRRNIVKYYLSLFIALSFAPQPKVFAQSDSTGCEAELYQLSSHPLGITPTLTAEDIIGNQVEQIGNNQEQPLPTTSPYNLSATKNIAKYWRMRVNNSDLPINNDDVKYTLIDSSEQNSPFKQNKFEAKPLDTKVEESCSDETTVVITGGVTLEFSELSSLVPGNFQGQIDVCVQIKDKPQCQ